MEAQVKTAFYLIIDHRIRDHIIKCTEEEAFRVLGTKRELDAAKLDAFIALLYAICYIKNLDVSYLWNKIWKPEFFLKTMSRNDFAEITRFIRFDKKSERSQRLRTNKFAIVSTVWGQFTKDSQNCYKPGAYGRNRYTRSVGRFSINQIYLLATNDVNNCYEDYILLML